MASSNTQNAAEVTSVADGDTSADTLGQISWAVFEWARNPYVLLVTIYLFAPYFSTVVVSDPVEGQILWGYANSAGGFIIAFFGPVAGAIADKGGRRKPWLLSFSILLAIASAFLWTATPNMSGAGLWFVLLMVIIANSAFELSAVFHNSMLPSVAPENRIGLVSGLGLALGNGAGVLLFIFMLCVFALPGVVDWPMVMDEPLFGIDREAHTHDRLVGPIAAIWLLVFMMPLMWFTPDRPSTGRDFGDMVFTSLRSLLATVRQLRKFRNIATFLIARMIYNDGKTAILIFGGVYAAGTFGWQTMDLIIYGIILSIFAFGGGLLGGFLDTKLGSRNAIIIEIIGTMVGLLGSISMTYDALFFVIPIDGHALSPIFGLPFFQTVPEQLYIAFVILVAIFITGAYASSRTMLAKLAPPEMMTQFFGIYALSGTAIAFLAPLSVAFFTDVFQSQRIGFGSSAGFLIIGLIIMFFVKEERAESL